MQQINHYTIAKKGLHSLCLHGFSSIFHARFHRKNERNPVHSFYGLVHSFLRRCWFISKVLRLFRKIFAFFASYSAIIFDGLALGWYEGNEDIAPFLKYLLGTILAAYKDFEDRFSLVETKHTALETVRLATQQKIGRFSKQDIRELCPSLSLSSLEGALRKMVASGELRREGNGKNTRYYRLK